MKTEQEVREWISNRFILTPDMNGIRGFILGAGLDYDLIFPLNVKDFSPKADFNDFVEWFNEPNEKVEDEVTEMTFESLHKLLKQTLDDMRRNLPRIFTMDLNPHSNSLFELYKEFVSEGARNSEEPKADNDAVGMNEQMERIRVNIATALKASTETLDYIYANLFPQTDDPKFPIGTKVVRKSKPNGKVYTIKKYFTEGRKGVKGRYLAVADDGSYMCGVRESKLERYEESSNTIKASLESQTDDPKAPQPKEGECFYVEGNFAGAYCILGDYKFYKIFGDDDVMFDPDHKLKWNKKAHTARPATEEEKQTLIKAVEEKYNKTYCEETKQWVDVKMVKFKKKLAGLINKYSLEETFGNKPDYAIAETMVHSALNADACKA